MPAKVNLSQYSTLFHQIFFGGVFIMIVLWATGPMMGGSTRNVMMVLMLMAGMAIILAMDKHYWLIIPVFQGLDYTIPGLPFNTLELGQIAVFTVYFIRRSLINTNERPVKFNSDLLIIMPMILWILGMYVYNPCGMIFTGSSTIGGRWYLQILFAFWALLVVSTWRFGEKECKILFWITLVVSSLTLSRSLFRGGLNIGPRIFNTERGTLYEFIGFINIYILMFARFRLADIVSSFWKLAVVMATGALVAYSGKRMMFGWVIMAPVFKTMITGRDKALAVICACVCAFVAYLVMAGDLEGIYQLPKSARRAFAIISPRMAEKYGVEGQGDRFRQIVHAEAMRQIKASPWIGLGGLAINRHSLIMANSFGNERKYNVVHGEARNWHSATYSYAADFGLPCLFFFLIFILVSTAKILWFSWRNVNVTPKYQSVMLLYTAINFCLVLIAFGNTGHSSLTIQTTFGIYGTFLAIRNGIQWERRRIGENLAQSLANA